MISSLVAAGFGFIFWIMAASYYSEADVGIASSAISAIGIITLLARFGMDQSMMRDISQDDRGNIFFTTIALVTISAVLFSIVFLSSLGIWAPELRRLENEPWIFIAVAISSCMFIVVGNAFLALRLPRLHLFQNIIAGLRVLLLPVLIGGGAVGILLSVGLGYTLPMIILLVLFHSAIKIKKINLNWAKKSICGSLSFYLNSIFTQIPALIMPLIVLYILGAETTAHYYMPYTIASIIFMIPVAVGTNLFVEISHGEDAQSSLRHAIKITNMIQMPVVILTVIFGSSMLSLFGQGYAENGTELLILLSFSSIFYGLVTIYLSAFRGLGLYRILILIGLILFATLIALSILFITWFGLNGVGLAWTIGHATILPFMLMHWNHVKNVSIGGSHDLHHN